jgi:phospholipase A-2-activating protein
MGHDDIVRGFTEVPGIGFASCSNDELVKVWTTDGLPIAQLRGHQGYVFNVSTLDTGEIISSSDDKSVRVWDVNTSTCKQVINHPGSVWFATQNHIGDIVTACEDYSIRTFTRDSNRADNGEAYKEFDA